MAGHAQNYSQKDNRLILCSRKKSVLDDIASNFENALTFEIDVRNHIEIKQMFKELAGKNVIPDVLINSAGLAIGVDELDKEEITEWNEIIDTKHKYKRIIIMSKFALKYMKQIDRGYIINIGSIASINPYSKGIAYAASKAAVLRENGYPVTRGDDFGLVSESKLGQIVKKKFNCDILVIKDYPDTIKKFYTKQKQGGLTETFDIIVDGWELVSGAVRETNGELIRKSMSLSDINIADYEFYISIVDGSIEHGGFCLGLDRLLAKILDKEMISDAVPFPRTYKKLIP